MLEEDIAIAYDSAVNIFGADVIGSWTVARQHAILNLVFNLGETKFRQFKRTIAAIHANDWVAAGDFLLDSLWAKQVKKRSERVVFMVKTGLFHDSYRPTA
jgi:GH24 family phage-related lysozyme (muramidase)